MTAWLGRRNGPGVAVIVAATGVLAAGTRWSVSVTAQKPPLTVERLAALPTLIGTAPAAPVWSPDNTRLTFLWNDQAMPFHDVWIVDAADGPPRRLTDLRGETRRLVALSATQPIQDDFPVLMADAADRLRTDGNGRAERQVTHSPPKEFGEYAWVQPRYVTFKSQVDGVTLHGRLMEPPHLDRSRKYPVIIGPVYSNTVRNQWRGTHATLQQYLAIEGQYIGLQVDIRGSVGYGREFRDRAVSDFAGITIDDLQSGVEYLKTLPYMDADRIGLWGWSYGGLLATMSVFQRPGLYKAVVAGAPATNVWHATTGEVDLAGRPSVNDDVFRRSSPVTYAKQLQDHLLIIHGMRDDIVLFKDSVLLTEKLMLLGKNFDFVFLPSSVHDAMRKDYVATFTLRKLVEHFDRYLGRGPTGGRPD